MHRIAVNLPQNSYEICVGAGLFQNLQGHLQEAGLHEPFLIISQPRILKAVGRGLTKKYPVALIPDGERAKTLTTVSRLIDRMVESRLDRQSTVIAFGGGVVGDIAGFAASIYMRGISVVQVPTTLLAQVDASIGGKTGTNHRRAKNLIGTYHQPRLVLTDPLLLRALPERHYFGGLYEALKYGIVRNRQLFDDFEKALPLLQKREPEALERLISACATVKAEVITADEREKDLRRILNFGHTIGHAIESAARFRNIKHGEAVAYGMMAASRISSNLGKVSKEEADRVEVVTRRVGRLPALDGVKLRPVLSALNYDKKVRDGALHFVLLRRIGEAEITPDVPAGLVKEVVKGILNEGKGTP